MKGKGHVFSMLKDLFVEESRRIGPILFIAQPNGIFATIAKKMDINKLFHMCECEFVCCATERKLNST